eukprot:481706-Lingulodinium_polyedra.AAC.1
MLQDANRTLHDDKIGGHHIIVIHTEQLDDMPPEPVIIETSEAFQLALLLPRVLLSVRHPLDHHDS